MGLSKSNKVRRKASKYLEILADQGGTHYLKLVYNGGLKKEGSKEQSLLRMARRKKHQKGQRREKRQKAKRQEGANNRGSAKGGKRKRTKVTKRGSPL